MEPEDQLSRAESKEDKRKQTLLVPLWKHSPAARVPTAFLVLPNFHSCFYNSIETRYMFSISYILAKIDSELNYEILLTLLRASKVVKDLVIAGNYWFDFWAVLNRKELCMTRLLYYVVAVQNLSWPNTVLAK